MHLYPIIIVFALALFPVVHGEELAATPDYFSEQFKKLSTERWKFKQTSDKLGEDALDSEYPLMLLELKHRHMAELAETISAIESILDSRPPAAIQRELTRDLEGIGRYAVFREGATEAGHPGGERHLIADTQIEYLLMRTVNRVKHCRDNLKWDYDFESLLKGIWLHSLNNTSGEGAAPNR